MAAAATNRAAEELRTKVSPKTSAVIQPGKFSASVSIFGVLMSPCHAELFILYFSSFEAGIANAIPSFK